MQLTISPMRWPSDRIDVARVVVAAIAEELWRRYGGNDVLNWIEAEEHVWRLMIARESDDSTFRRRRAWASGVARPAITRRPRPGPAESSSAAVRDAPNLGERSAPTARDRARVTNSSRSNRAESLFTRQSDAPRIFHD